MNSFIIFLIALQEHVELFTDHQRSHIPHTILDVIFSQEMEPSETTGVKEEPIQAENSNTCEVQKEALTVVKAGDDNA